MSADEVAGKMEEVKVGDAPAAVNNGLEEDDDVVDPWKVESKSAKGVDYDKLISKHPEDRKSISTHSQFLALSLT